MTTIKQGKRLTTPVLTVAAASLATVMFTSYAMAQCVECDEYQNRDPFTQGLAITPPANEPGTTSAAKPHRSPYNSRAEMRDAHNHHLQTEHRHP